MELDFSLHPGQLEVFGDPTKYKVVAAGRRFGKSFLSAVTLLVEGLKDVNERGYDLTNKDVWYVAPTFQQGKDIMWATIKTLGKEVIESTVENTATIRLINGRQIKIKGSDRPDTLRGSGLGYLVLDEYADMKANVWEEILMPTLTDVEGGALFIGTPKGKNHFYEVFMSGQGADDDFKSWHFNSTDNPLLSKDLINKARDRMSTNVYRQEFEANFNATGGALFSEDMIKYDSTEPTDGMMFMAVDLAGFADARELSKGNAKRLDETSIAVVKVSTDGWWVKTIDSGRWGIRETSLRILRLAQEHKVSTVGIEKGSLMNAILPYMEDQMKRIGVYPRIDPLTHGGKKKTERITWALQGRFQHGRITLNRGGWNKKLIEQLLDFPNPLAHDDLIDSLAYIDQVAVTSYNHFVELPELEILDDYVGI